ncbi:MAG: hypothetical protein ACHQ2Z_07680 [Elusimicrobiota bacterium]
MSEAARPGFRAEAAGVFTAHLALTALTFVRLWPRLQTDAVVKSEIDFGPNLWLQWWGPFAAGRGLNPFRTSWMFHPAGSALSIDAGVVQWILAAPLSLMLNPLGVYNVLAAFSYLATGLVSYVLFRLYSRPAGAFLGSLAFTFSAYRNYRFLVSHTDLLQTQWCVLLILAYVLYARPDRTIKNGGWLLACAALACGADPRSLLMTVLFLAVFTAAALRDAGRAAPGRARTLAGKALVLASAVAVFILPTAVPAMREMGLFWGATPRHPEAFRAGWRELLLLPNHHALRAFAAEAPNNWRESNGGYWNPALLALTAAGLARCRERRDVRPFAAALAVFAVLAAARWPLAHLPVLALLHVPARFALITTLCASLFAALGWDWTSPRLSPLARRLLWGSLAAAVFLETNPVFQRPSPVWDADASALEAVRTAGGAGAVVDLPVSLSPMIAGQGSNFRAFLRATRHERPIVNGNLSFPSAAVREHLLARTDLQSLFACQERGDCAALDDGSWRRLRRDEDMRFLIVDKRDPATPLTAALLRTPSVARFAESGDLEVFEIVEGPAGRQRR